MGECFWRSAVDMVLTVGGFCAGLRSLTCELRNCVSGFRRDLRGHGTTAEVLAEVIRVDSMVGCGIAGRQEKEMGVVLLMRHLNSVVRTQRGIQITNQQVFKSQLFPASQWPRALPSSCLTCPSLPYPVLFWPVLHSPSLPTPASSSPPPPMPHLWVPSRCPPMPTMS